MTDAKQSSDSHGATRRHAETGATYRDCAYDIAVARLVRAVELRGY